MYSRNILTSSLVLFVCLSIQIEAQKDSTKNSVKYWSAGSKEIWQTVDGLLNDPNLTSASWGVMVQSMSSGEVLYKRNENKLLNSASLVKLFTTATALSFLGNDFTYETQIRTTGVIEGATLNGDLIIVGSGDPTISGRLYNDDIFFVFNQWAEKLIDLGIMSVSGSLIGDNSAFEELGLGKGWQWDHLSDWYAAPASALSLNDNAVDITIFPGELGFSPEIDLTPMTKYITVINDIVTVPADSTTKIEISRDNGSNIIRLSGRIRLNNKPYSKSVSIESPAEFFVQVLSEVLQRRGIRVQGGWKVGSNKGPEVNLKGTTLLFKHYSKQLSEIVRLCNKNSYNFYAEQLLKTLGVVDAGYGSTANGLMVVNQYLEKAKIDPTELKLVDGSGLSLLNLTSAEHYAKLLRYIFKSDYSQYFFNSLPVAGKDGSLADRLLDASSANNLRGKPGLNEGVRSLAGYLKTADNETLAVVFISNNHLVPFSYIDNIIDKICNKLSILKRKK
ncbi:MAG: D-alanyl-D-alanine carboxypeptidase/D-alanyl-D-alanine-endopeptidase [Ignavibacteriales bacterium]|nr:D-alanyl-D-alanine carboxypeptidase/D-alanyl-D-alanine-endopeptidase [Ignavibacteriales bacterium]